MSCITDKKTSVLVEELKLAVDLYKHEASLNWDKFRHALYGMGLLAGAYYYAVYHVKYCFIAWVISAVGLVASITILLSLYNGLRFLRLRGETLQDIEKRLPKCFQVEHPLVGEVFGWDNHDVPIAALYSLALVVLVVWAVLFHVTLQSLRAGNWQMPPCL